MHRITIDIDDDTFDELESLKKKTDKNLTQLFKEGLVLVALAATAKDQSFKLAVVNPEKALSDANDVVVSKLLDF